MSSREEFIQNLITSGLMKPDEIQAVLTAIPVADRPSNARALARYLTKQGLLTDYQAEAIREQKFDRLSVAQYDLIDRLGEGGMGEVFKARHRRMKRIVAIKMLRVRAAESATILRRFEREVELIASLDHPNIVTAYDADECEAGPYLVMEFVDGPDLETIVKEDGPMSIPLAVDCVLQAAHGLQHAHAGDVIHRDVKPANLLRDKETGCIKITDLGLAKLDDELREDGTGKSSLTQSGNILGTVFYMAPEQAGDKRRVDGRADIYSLGCTLFLLLTGRPPYLGESAMETLIAHREEPIPKLGDVRGRIPAALEAAFQRMMAKEPADRFQTMSEVIEAFQSAQHEVVADGERAQMDTTITSESDNPLNDTVVLLVEPSRTQSFLIESHLTSLGAAQVERSRSGEEAIAAVDKLQPSVVISARHLDDMTGPELAEKIIGRSPNSDIGFILISSASDSELSNSAIRVLNKPFNEQDLRKVLIDSGNVSAGDS